MCVCVTWIWGVVMYMPVLDMCVCTWHCDTEELKFSCIWERSLFHSFLLKEVKKIKEALEVLISYSWSSGNVKKYIRVKQEEAFPQRKHNQLQGLTGAARLLPTHPPSLHPTHPTPLGQRPSAQALAWKWQARLAARSSRWKKGIFCGYFPYWGLWFFPLCHWNLKNRMSFWGWLCNTALETRGRGEEGSAWALRIHQALKEVDCAMFEDAKIITVLGTVLRGEEAEQQEESGVRSWFRTGSPPHLLPQGDKKAPRHILDKATVISSSSTLSSPSPKPPVPFLMSFRTPTSICIQHAKYNSVEVFITIHRKKKISGVRVYSMSIALELKQISFGLETDVNKLKESSQLWMQHMEQGPSMGHVRLSASQGGEVCRALWSGPSDQAALPDTE